jgi:fructuronate reductase
MISYQSNTHAAEAQLSEKNLGYLNCNAEPLGYDRAAVSIGIVHFGPGAFHRAHQAVYTDDLLKRGEKNWGICAVSINSQEVRNELLPQDNLYTLAILDNTVSYRVIGAIKEILVALQESQKVIERLSQASVKIVTLTITEKGYCLNAEGGLDLSHTTIVHDLGNPQTPKSAIGFLVAGLAQRRLQNRGPLTIISCDNLTNNGKRLQRAVLDFAFCIDRTLVAWIEREVYFPCSMVDSITPATHDNLRNSVSNAIGLSDNWPIQRERFSQWVIEDIPNANLPPWVDVGVTLSKDVHGYEVTKLRILNGMHSSIAFIGILAGIEDVRDAILQPNIRAFIQTMLQEEIIPTLPKVDGLDPIEYGKKIIERFENPAICHLLAQIAWDSTQKIPFRILDTIADNLALGKPAPKLCFVIAAWMKFICLKVKKLSPITDPLAKQLELIALACDGTAEDVKRFLQLNSLFSNALVTNSVFLQDVIKAYLAIGCDVEGNALNTIF